MLTISDMCKLYDVEPHQVRHIINTRGIRPAQRAGMTDLYDSAAMNEISTSLRAIKTRTTRGVRARETRVLQNYETR